MEWTVVTVIIALIGLIGVFVKAASALTKAMTELTIAVRTLQEQMHEQQVHAKESHAKLWTHNSEQDKRLDDHEWRIKDLEDHKE